MATELRAEIAAAERATEEQAGANVAQARRFEEQLAEMEARALESAEEVRRAVGLVARIFRVSWDRNICVKQFLRQLLRKRRSLSHPEEASANTPL